MAQDLSKKAAKENAGAAEAKKGEANTSVLALGKINFIMIAVCVLLIIVGFSLMTGSANEGTTWNPDIFNATRTVVGPAISLAGFVLLIFAIIFKKK